MQTFFSIIDVILVTVLSLLIVAFTTVAERKTMASMQRRVGPNIVGFYGILQAFADALKLLLKEYVAPTQANLIIFFLGPIITLIFSLLGYAIVPYGPGLTLGDMDLGILYALAVSSLATYGILLAGWSANSKYAFLGSLRSTAQLISYELILSSAILLVVILTSSLSVTINVESQKIIYFLFPLFPVFIMFFIGAIAETNRAPFDLAEAESELVSGFMTEHSSVIFVFFFLGEYASIVLICLFTIALFIGGYLLYILIITFIYQSLLFSLSIGYKACCMVFLFIWVRASFPRIRFDQLMSFCWTILLPAIIALIIIIPTILEYISLLPSTLFADPIEQNSGSTNSNNNNNTNSNNEDVCTINPKSWTEGTVIGRVDMIRFSYRPGYLEQSFMDFNRVVSGNIHRPVTGFYECTIYSDANPGQVTEGSHPLVGKVQVGDKIGPRDNYDFKSNKRWSNLMEK